MVGFFFHFPPMPCRAFLGGCMKGYRSFLHPLYHFIFDLDEPELILFWLGELQFNERDGCDVEK